MNFKKMFFSCSHKWEQSTIRQVKVENGRLVGFTTKTPLLLECSKCGEKKDNYKMISGELFPLN